MSAASGAANASSTSRGSVGETFAETTAPAVHVKFAAAACASVTGSSKVAHTTARSDAPPIARRKEAAVRTVSSATFQRAKT